MKPAVRRLGFFVALLFVGVSFAAEQGPLRPMTVEDELRIVQISGTAVSPDGEWIAAQISRPVGPSENNGTGRTECWCEPRADIWLLSRRTGERRNLTNGAVDGSGYWAATWSPDGQRLAMVSTRPEHGESRGGDNARLYVWDKATGALTRLEERGVLFSAKIQLPGARQQPSGRGIGGTFAFAWLSDTELLAVVLPPGESSMTHATRLAMQGWARTEDGVAPSVSVLESDGPPAELPKVTLLRLDVAHATHQVVAEFPCFRPAVNTSLHPCHVHISPDRNTAALVVETNTEPIGKRETDLHLQITGDPSHSWARALLGFVSLVHPQPVRWVTAGPGGARIGSMLSWSSVLRWSPDGSTLALLGRKTAEATEADTVFGVSSLNGSVRRWAPEDMVISDLLWTTDGHLLVYGRHSGDKALGDLAKKPARADWWRLDSTTQPVNLTTSLPHVPTQLQPAGVSDRFFGLADGTLWSIDSRRDASVQVISDPRLTGGRVVWPRKEDAAFSAPQQLLVQATQDGRALLTRVQLPPAAGGRGVQLTEVRRPDAAAELTYYAPAQDLSVFHDVTPTGTFLWTADAIGAKLEKRFAVNEFLAGIAPGRQLHIHYRGFEGDSLTGIALLPPNYQQGKRYPVMVWVYPGNTSAEFLAENLSGTKYPQSLSMELLAARGYVVLFLSMPLYPIGEKLDPYLDISKGVMAGIDQLIDQGIADPQRLAVGGTSYGGYSTYTLVTYTACFKAAISMAGPADLSGLYGQFIAPDRYGDGAQQENYMRGILESGATGMGGTPWDDLWHYLRNSPLFYLDRVRTPLMIVQGDQDVVSMSQGEEFFTGLYRLGKRSKFLRYWGEGHQVMSPANVHHMWGQIYAWLDENCDVTRDANGNLVFDGDHVRSRNGAAPLKPEDFLRFEQEAAAARASVPKSD